MFVLSSLLFSLRVWGPNPYFGWWRESGIFFIIKIGGLLCSGGSQIILWSLKAQNSSVFSSLATLAQRQIVLLNTYTLKLCILLKIQRTEITERKDNI